MDADPVRARLDLAARIAPAWGALPEVVAVVVSGSTARGLADAWSDLELGVYWRRVPTDAERDAAIVALGAALDRRVSTTSPAGWFGVDNLRVDGFPVDVAMNVTDGVEQAIAAVLDRRDLAEPLLDLVAMLAEVQPLVGGAWVAGWQPRLVVDRALGAALAERALRLLPAAGLEVDLARGSAVRVMQRLVHWAEAGLRAVYPIGGRWYPGDKAAWARLPQLASAPPDSTARLTRGLSGPTRAAGEVLLAWLDEVLAAAERAGADIDAARRRLHAPSRRGAGGTLPGR